MHDERRNRMIAGTIRVGAALWLTMLACGPAGTPAAMADTGRDAHYDARPWLEDLAQIEGALHSKYANLEWLVMEREVDVAALFDETAGRLRESADDAAARAALDRLVRKIGDGHVVIQWRPPGAAGPSTTDCAALGYDARMAGEPLAALMPGYAPLTHDAASEFPAGTVEAGGRRVGILKIGIFTPQGIPSLCTAAIAALHLSPGAPCDEACADRIDAWASARMTADLAAQIRALRTVGAQVLLVDVADNGGGSEWAEAAARMLTAVPLQSARLGFVRGEHWVRSFARKAATLRAYAENAEAGDRRRLETYAISVDGLQREAATPCDSDPLWRRQSPGCSWLGRGWYATGLLAADTQAVHGKPWARELFTPEQFDFPRGVWRGPLLVLVNGNTGSAAEEFAALLQDNRAALIIGAPTAGAGCGHTDGGTPTTLANSGARLELPDCARWRRDGSNEVMGVQPDLLIGLRAVDGPRRRALRVAARLGLAVRCATTRCASTAVLRP